MEDGLPDPQTGSLSAEHPPSGAATESGAALPNELIEELMKERTAASWVGRLEAAGVPCAPFQAPAEVIAPPRTVAHGMPQETPDRRMALMGLPLRFDGERPATRRGPPALGEHTATLIGAVREAAE